MNSWKTEKALANFARVANVDCQVLDHGATLECLIPGVGIENFDCYGVLSTWNAQRLVQILRYMRTNTNHYFHALESGQYGTFILVVAFSVEFHPKMWTEVKLEKPLKLSMSALHLSNSSCSQIFKIKDPQTDIDLATMTYLFANVDIENQKAAPFHKQYVKEMGHCFKGTKPVFTPMKRPSSGDIKVHHLTRQAPASDMDHHFHVTQPMFQKYCLDAASLGAQQGLLRCFDKDSFVFCRVKKIETVMSQQVFEGDVIDIFMWEIKEEPYKVYFELQKRRVLVSRSFILFDNGAVNAKL